MLLIGTLMCPDVIFLTEFAILALWYIISQLVLAVKIKMLQNMLVD